MDKTQNKHRVSKRKRGGHHVTKQTKTRRVLDIITTRPGDQMDKRRRPLDLIPLKNGCLQTPVCIENTYTRLFLLDTGCEVSMISQRDLTTYNLKSIVNRLHPKVVCFRAMS
ncbi:hypothetical protein Pcinc_007074 [Petrolisthes cinctipes]|uniref:Uncharacterized protein n=1 Tax=Petrolisthes cinctipes TaxID=88211 RepID=A0AAE1G968_PETCI|nr:hypothetical protein Pcinc_007074 [Petrolisthes cinctipes]